MSEAYIILGCTVALSFLIYILTKKDNKESMKELFVSDLKKNVVKVKTKIINLSNKSYTQNEKISIIEDLQDLLLYQGFDTEKNKYLTREQGLDLFRLQEDIEDYVAQILVQYEVESFKQQSKETLNIFLTKFDK